MVRKQVECGDLVRFHTARGAEVVVEAEESTESVPDVLGDGPAERGEVGTTGLDEPLELPEPLNGILLIASAARTPGNELSRATSALRVLSR